MSTLAASLIGTIPQWLTVASIIAGAAVIMRGSAGPALTYEREANKTLREQNTELERELKAAHVELATWKAKTDLAPMIVRHEEILERLATHEHRAQERFEKTCGIMELIAARLGPEQSH